MYFDRGVNGVFYESCSGLRAECECRYRISVVVKVVEKKDMELVCLDESEEEKEECGICLEVLQDVATLSSCKHRFCFKCISHWMEKKNVCPYCKGEFESISRVVNGKTEVTLCEKRVNFNIEIIRVLPRFGRRIERNVYLRSISRALNLDITDSDSD